MIYSVILADLCYEPRLEIPNPSELDGWTDAMGVPYWVLGYAYNDKSKWRASRKDRCPVEGEGGFWMGSVEGAEFFIQDLDFDFDPRFEEGLIKHRWKNKAEKKAKSFARVERVVYEYGVVEARPVVNAALPEGWAEVPMPAPQPVAAPPPARNRIREALEGAAARALNWAPAPIAPVAAAAVEAAEARQAAAVQAVVRQRQFMDAYLRPRPAFEIEVDVAPVQQALPDPVEE